MPKKSGTIHIKWVRSGIGFSRKQRDVVKSIGLRRLNQVVERPDTVHFRGLVAKLNHLVEVVGPTVAPAWAGVPEYKIVPAEAAPEKAAPAAKKAAKPVAADVPAATEVKAKTKAEEPPKKAATAKSRAAKASPKPAPATAEKAKPKAKKKPAAPKAAATAKKETKSKKGKK